MMPVSYCQSLCKTSSQSESESYDSRRCYFQDLNQQLEKKGKDRVDGTFMRKGKAGDWKAHFTPELERRFKEWEDRWLRGSDLKFDYGL